VLVGDVVDTAELRDGICRLKPPLWRFDQPEIFLLRLFMEVHGGDR
jgi:hypothetical protein